MANNRWPTLQELKNSVAGKDPRNAHVFEEKEKKAKANKYLNQVIEFDGKVFDSKKELGRYIVLRAKLAANEITHLHCQTNFTLSVCTYIADFTYTQEGKLIVEDIKSKSTRRLPVFQLKKKLMAEELQITIIEL